MKEDLTSNHFGDFGLAYHDAWACAPYVQGYLINIAQAEALEKLTTHERDFKDISATYSDTANNDLAQNGVLFYDYRIIDTDYGAEYLTDTDREGYKTLRRNQFGCTIALVDSVFDKLKIKEGKVRMWGYLTRRRTIRSAKFAKLFIDSYQFNKQDITRDQRHITFVVTPGTPAEQTQQFNEIEALKGQLGLTTQGALFAPQYLAQWIKANGLKQPEPPKEPINWAELID